MQARWKNLRSAKATSKLKPSRSLVAVGNDKAAVILQALAEGELVTAGKRVLIVKGDSATDALTGAKLPAVPADKEDISVNNRLRRELAGALAALKLVSPQRDVRLAAAKELGGGADPAMLPLVKKALSQETDAAIKPMLEQIAATLELRAEDRSARLAAVKKLASSNNASTKSLLLSFIETEKDDELRAEAQRSLREIESGLAWGERVGIVFTSVSLGSILLLAALGLAITYGLMGVINMAHGELIMIGAYATYVVQGLFRSTAFFDWYLIAAIPVAFAVSALVGMALERTVIRWLYGRPLETLLATWGISLILIQAVRTIFGAQNVQVENPAFMSGGVELLTGVVLPWSRIVIIGFAFAVVFLDLSVAEQDAARLVRARRDAEPRDGVVRRRADCASRHVGVRARLRHRRPRRLRAFADRQRRPRPRPELHRRLVHGRRARRCRPAGRDCLFGARTRLRQQAA